MSTPGEPTFSLYSAPGSLAVYGYAHLPQLFKAQRPINENGLSSNCCISGGDFQTLMANDQAGQSA